MPDPSISDVTSKGRWPDDELRRRSGHIMDLEAEVERLREALHRIIDMNCPAGYDGDFLHAAQRIASQALVRSDINREGRPRGTHERR